MKKIILVIIISNLLPSITYSQLFHLDGFWGLEFNDSKTLVQKKVLNAYGYKPAKIDQSANTIIYQGIKFGGNNSDGAILAFMDDKLFLGKIVIRPETSQQLLKVYKKLVYDISLKYHQPNESSFELLYPYSKENSEGEILLAIEGGYSNIYSNWIFEGDNGFKNSIVAEVFKDGYILLTYAYGPLYSKFQKLQNDRISSQY